MTLGAVFPQPFGRYVLREKIAAGGMAEVFRATQPGFGGFEKVVAIKRMFRRYAHDDQFIEMLTDEAKIVSQLSHPNIVQILDISRLSEDYYIAFEFVDGVDLFHLLQRHFELKRELPIHMVIFVIAELCSALDYAHARCTTDGHPMHIIHRDVSPQNVLLSNLGEVKLTDFGIAKAAYRLTQTQAGVLKGKLYYMSPEHARGDQLDHRSDLFSAGILLYELLCTRPLYDEEDQGKLLAMVESAQFEWPIDKRNTLPAALMKVAEKALARHPDDRYQTGRSFREDLMQVAEQLNLRCDREELGSYIRALYGIAEDRPPAPHQLPAQPPPETHWASTIATVPQRARPQSATSPAATSPAAKIQIETPAAKTPAAKTPAAKTPAAKTPAAKTPATKIQDETPAPRSPPSLDALLMPTTRPLSEKAAKKMRDLGLGGELPPPIPPQHLTHPEAHRESLQRPNPKTPPTLAKQPPPLSNADDDESTSLIDLSEIRARLNQRDDAPPEARDNEERDNKEREHDKPAVIVDPAAQTLPPPSALSDGTALPLIETIALPGPATSAPPVEKSPTAPPLKLKNHTTRIPWRWTSCGSRRRPQLQRQRQRPALWLPCRATRTCRPHPSRCPPPTQSSPTPHCPAE